LNPLAGKKFTPSPRLWTGTFYMSPGSRSFLFYIHGSGGFVLLQRFLFLFFSCASLRDLRTQSADRRKTLPHDPKLVALHNPGPKIRRALHRKKNWGQKHAKFGGISDNFRLRSRISPGWIKISKIGKTCDPITLGF